MGYTYYIYIIRRTYTYYIYRERGRSVADESRLNVVNLHKKVCKSMYDRENDFEIVPMSKQELALMYAPNLTPHAAVNRMMQWIGRHPKLSAELAANGYRKTSRIFTALHVGLIVKYLGAP